MLYSVLDSAFFNVMVTGVFSKIRAVFLNPGLQCVSGSVLIATGLESRALLHLYIIAQAVSGPWLSLFTSLQSLCSCDSSCCGPGLAAFGEKLVPSSGVVFRGHSVGPSVPVAKCFQWTGWNKYCTGVHQQVQA